MSKLHRPKGCQELALTVAADPGGIKMAARLDAKKAPTVAFRSRCAWRWRLSNGRCDLRTRDAGAAVVFHRMRRFPTR